MEELEVARGAVVGGREPVVDDALGEGAVDEQAKTG
jgi:hypothetical protein